MLVKLNKNTEHEIYELIVDCVDVPLHLRRAFYDKTTGIIYLLGDPLSLCLAEESDEKINCIQLDRYFYFPSGWLHKIYPTSKYDYVEELIRSTIKKEFQE